MTMMHPQEMNRLLGLLEEWGIPQAKAKKAILRDVGLFRDEELEDIFQDTPLVTENGLNKVSDFIGSVNDLREDVERLSSRMKALASGNQPCC